MPHLTRRQLLIGGAAAVGARALGCGRLFADPYDLCVVGSGFAGLFLALRAVERGLRTVLVEAGTANAQSFAFTASGEVDYPLGGTRFIGPGGTSRLWGGVVTRLWPDDFEIASRYGHGVDWPLRYADLAPYYCRAEQRLAARGRAPIEDAEPPRTCTYPQPETDAYVAPSVSVEGRRLPFFPVARSTRGSFPIRLEDEELPAFRRSPHATFLDGRQAVRLVTRDGRRVDHLVVRAPDGALTPVAADRFVVAAGVAESARLLLLSRSEWFPDGMGNRHGLVGRFFGAHPWWGATLPHHGGSFPLGSHRSYALTQRYRRDGLNGCWFQLEVPDALRAQWRVSAGMEPRAENRVALSERARDAFGTPVVDVRMGFSERDRRTFERARGALDGASLDYEARWHWHPSGTCRMGADEKSGVVDPNGRVFGLENLYVSGACTFPSAGTANPTNTVVALTLRLADHLLAG